MRLFMKYRTKLVLLLDQGIVSGVSFVLSILLVRSVGIQVFGQFGIVLIIAQGLVAVNQALITSPYQSLHVQLASDIYNRELKGGQLLLMGVLLFFFFIVMVIIQVFNLDIFDLQSPTCLIYFIGFILFDFNRKQLYLHKKYLFCFVKDLISMASQLLSLGLLIYLENLNSLDDVLLITGGCLMIVEGGVFLFFRTPKMPSVSIVVRHWSFGKWMLGKSILQWFSGNFFITTGALIMGADVVGVVRIGQSIIGVWGVFLQLLENYVPPLTAAIYDKSGAKGLKEYLVRLSLKGSAFIALAAILIVVFRDLIWEAIYGPDFLDYTFIMYWFGPILVLNFLGFPLRFAVRTMNKTRVLFEAYLISCLFCFASAHFIISSFGIHGICLGLLLTQVIMQGWYGYRLIKIYYHEDHSYSIR